jgi:hypothetical protein
MVVWAARFVIWVRFDRYVPEFFFRRLSSVAEQLIRRVYGACAILCDLLSPRRDIHPLIDGLGRTRDSSMLFENRLARQWFPPHSRSASDCACFEGAALDEFAKFVVDGPPRPPQCFLNIG